MGDTGFYFKARAEGNASERTNSWLLRVPFQLEKMHGSSVQLQPRVVHVLLIEGSISPSSRGRLPSRARGLLLAGDKVLSLPGSPGCEGTAAAEGAREKRGEHRREQEEEQNSSCTCSHKSSLLTALETATAPSSEEACAVPSWHLLGREGSCWGKITRKIKE